MENFQPGLSLIAEELIKLDTLDYYPEYGSREGFETGCNTTALALAEAGPSLTRALQCLTPEMVKRVVETAFRQSKDMFEKTDIKRDVGRASKELKLRERYPLLGNLYAGLIRASKNYAVPISGLQEKYYAYHRGGMAFIITLAKILDNIEQQSQEAA
jgi:hypothetical protein